MTVATAQRGERRLVPPTASGGRACVALAIIGVLLIAAPVVFGMFTRAPQGATMIKDYQPFMTEARLDTYQSELAVIRAGVRETNTKAAAQFRSAGLQKPRSGTQVPAYQSFNEQWPVIDKTMSDLLTKVRRNIGNYDAVAALPPFGLFPWFFVAPGVILIGLARAALRLPGRRPQLRIVIALLGVGLIAAPVVFQMFTRAPKGGHMMNDFEDIETTQTVQRIQGYFAEIASGQGSIRLDIVPALRKTGLGKAEVAKRFPAMTALDEQWPAIQGDFAPMIGAMSDNVPRYQAVTALPPFPMFPWFFVMPGVLIAVIAIGARPRLYQKE